MITTSLVCYTQSIFLTKLRRYFTMMLGNNQYHSCVVREDITGILSEMFKLHNNPIKTPCILVKKCPNYITCTFPSILFSEN